MLQQRRVLIALGGSALTASDGGASPGGQRGAVETAMSGVAALIAAGTEVVLVSGAGPRADALGSLMAGALESALDGRGITRFASAIVARVRVGADDPVPSRPAALVGRGPGRRRPATASRPQEVLDAPAVRVLLAAGVIPIAAVSGAPVLCEVSGALRDADAVPDQDRAAALLARAVYAGSMVIATDAPNAVLDHGTPDARPVGRISAARLARYAAEGRFAQGGMGPRIDAALRFVAEGGGRAVITALDRLADGVAGAAGTVIEP